MQLTQHVDMFFQVINFTGLVAFAVSGAVAAKKRDADIFGVLVLSLVASTCGGIIRDLLMGSLPPDVMRTNLPLGVALATGFVTHYAYPLINKLRYPIEMFDALGLGLYAVLGSLKAMAYGISPVWSVGMGVLTAVGGGVMRDISLAQVPTIFKTEIYATAAVAGAVIMVAGRMWLPEHEKFVMLAGATVCTGLRLAAVHYRWNVRAE